MSGASALVRACHGLYRQGMDDVQDVMKLAFARKLSMTGEARRLREQAGLHQGEIARTINVASATVSRWEGGSRLPTGAPGVRYADLLRRLRRQVTS